MQILSIVTPTTATATATSSISMSMMMMMNYRIEDNFVSFTNGYDNLLSPPDGTFCYVVFRLLFHHHQYNKYFSSSSSSTSASSSSIQRNTIIWNYFNFQVDHVQIFHFILQTNASANNNTEVAATFGNSLLIKPKFFYNRSSNNNVIAVPLLLIKDNFLTTNIQKFSHIVMFGMSEFLAFENSSLHLENNSCVVFLPPASSDVIQPDQFTFEVLRVNASWFPQQLTIINTNASSLRRAAFDCSHRIFPGFLL